MKHLIIALLLVSAVGCSTSTKYGDCVGLMDTKDKSLNYETSIWNIAVGFIFSETLIVPVMVVAKQLECPVSKR